jgi:hypothetical protein
VGTLMEVLSFIQVIRVVNQELHLQPAFDMLLELLIKTSHIHSIPLYVREALFVQEEFADAAELLVVVPKLSILYCFCMSINLCKSLSVYFLLSSILQWHPGTWHNWGVGLQGAWSTACCPSDLHNGGCARFSLCHLN